MTDSTSKDKKILLFPKAQKALDNQEAQNIDTSNPVGTVYGVQQWIDGKLIGTSLYSSAAKQNFVIQTLRREYEQRKKLHTEERDDPYHLEEYKGINYEVY